MNPVPPITRILMTISYQASAMSDWTSYDSGAAIHNRVAVPKFFAAPARDLAAALEVRAGQWILDVGSGSGAAALAALATTGREAWVVSIDPSPAMLRSARENGVSLVVAGGVPGLPTSKCVKCTIRFR